MDEAYAAIDNRRQSAPPLPIVEASGKAKKAGRKSEPAPRPAAVETYREPAPVRSRRNAAPAQETAAPISRRERSPAPVPQQQQQQRDSMPNAPGSIDTELLGLMKQLNQVRRSSHGIHAILRLCDHLGHTGWNASQDGRLWHQSRW